MADRTPKQSKAPLQAVSSEKKKSTHPTYFDMISSAVVELKNRKGFTMQAIRNFISSTYDVSNDNSFNSHIKKTVTKMIENGHLSQIAGSGFSPGSRFKLVQTSKKILTKSENVAKKKSPALKKTTVAKKTGEKKTTTTKKTPEKKASTSTKTASPKRTTANSHKTSKDVEEPKKKTTSKASKENTAKAPKENTAKASKENTAKASNKDTAVEKTPTKSKRSAKA